LFALSESYPDLKSNQNYLELQRELTDTEDKIQAARRFYNSTVTAYNTKIETFPSNIIASKFTFLPADLFELGEGEQAARDVVKVSFA
jgi:LemA protein